MNVLGAWGQGLRQAGMVGRLVLDTYYPEIGRYGHGTALDAAEDVFVADSRLAATELRHLAALDVHRTALTVANMVGIVSGFFGDLADAMDWLAVRHVPTTPAPERAVANQAIRLALDLSVEPPTSAWPTPISQAWQARADALVNYRKHLPEAGRDTALESLMHMHHKRAIGIDPESERTCHHLARQTARAWRARQAGRTREAG